MLQSNLLPKSKILAHKTHPLILRACLRGTLLWLALKPVFFQTTVPIIPKTIDAQRALIKSNNILSQPDSSAYLHPGTSITIWLTP